LGNATTPDLILTNAECTNLILDPGESLLISKYNNTDANTLLNIQSDCVFGDLELDLAGENLTLYYQGRDLDVVEM